MKEVYAREFIQDLVPLLMDKEDEEMIQEQMFTFDKYEQVSVVMLSPFASWSIYWSCM